MNSENKYSKKQNSSASPDFFIVGSGRSGTTLFKVLLSRLEEFDVPDESSFVVRSYYRLGKLTDFTIEDYQFAARKFCEWSIDSWGLQEADIVNHLAKGKPNSYKELNDMIYGLYYQDKIRPMKWGIKKPIFIIQLKRLMRIYPNTPIIHVVRDVRDTYLSFKTLHNRKDVRSFGPKSCITVALYWRYGLKCYKIIPNKFKKEIKYENLITDPNKCIEDLLNFFAMNGSIYEKKLDFDSNYKNQNLSVGGGLLDTIHEKLKGPIDSKNKNKYLKAMKPWQIFVVELICADYLEKYGYRLKYPFLLNNALRPFRFICECATGAFYQTRYFLRDYKVSKS